ncbi:hypothetical protein BCV70DRAFT_200589 [Testicularia cyperi]|uniref:Uncharacterized protein n=1 Tax=Testicularia cyperi TaxID=1882483 RepID=A0A317XMV6_9BASI|nr:hypothetical protein BCV70DRAFT_200589 [Testicularia cyperi]
MVASKAARVMGAQYQTFADAAILEATIHTLTVAQAKALLKDLNNAPESICGRLAVSGNKPELINRLIGAMKARKDQGDIRGYQLFRDFLCRYKVPSSQRCNYPSTPGGTLHAGGGRTLGGTPSSKFSAPAAPSASHSSHLHAGAAPSSSSSSTIPAARPSASATVSKINFRPSPFWEIKQFVCQPVQCAEAPTNADRRTASIILTFTAEQLETLKQPNHQVKLFCTTYEAQAASLSGRNPAPLDFPLACEARVNGTTLTVNLRGSKKHVGRVPPPNLNKDKALVLVPNRPNRVDLTYTNAPKKHVLVAAICQVTSAETLVEQLKRRQFTTKEEVLSKMRREAEDEEIQEGAATMSLKCPLSYMRMTTPCKSNFCPHVQCFDAYSFFSVNEQSPSWTCPVCNRTIKPEDVVIDGYVADILKRVPQDEETVIVEPDGAWRTADGKVSSTGTALPTPAANTPVPDPLARRESADDVKPSVVTRSNDRGSPDEIVLLDSPSPPPASNTGQEQAAPLAQPASGGTLHSHHHQQHQNGSAHVRGAASTPASTSAPKAPIPTSTNLAGATSHLSPAPTSGRANGGPIIDRMELLASSSTSQASSSARASPMITAEVIDLTLDSDDDAEPSVPVRPPPSRTNGVAVPSQPPARNWVDPARAANFATPVRTGPFTSPYPRAEDTPEEDQIRPPGKRSRYEPSADPRLANGVRPHAGLTVNAATSPSASALPPPPTAHAPGMNGIRSHANGHGVPQPLSAAAAPGPVPAPPHASAPAPVTALAPTMSATTSVPPSAAPPANDDWMDTDTQDHERYFDDDDDDWWSSGA